MKTMEKSYTQWMINGDADRKTKLHDKLCEFLTKKEVVEKISNRYADPKKWFYDFKVEDTFDECQHLDYDHIKDKRYLVFKCERKYLSKSHYVKYDYALSKIIVHGSGFIKGFLDLYLNISYNMDYREIITPVKFDLPSYRKEQLKLPGKTLSHGTASHNISVIVEAKTGEISIAGLIQQLKTYETFVSCDKLLACGLTDIPNEHKEILKNHGIDYIYVPRKFL